MNKNLTKLEKISNRAAELETKLNSFKKRFKQTESAQDISHKFDE